MYELLGTCVALAALLILNSLLTAAAALVWRLVARRARRWAPEASAQALFLLRVFPAAFSLAVVLTLLVPAYVVHEPRDSEESVGLKLLLLSLLSAAGVALAAARVVATWRATSRLVRDWVANSEPISVEGCPLPAYRLRHRFPVVAVVGVLRPRLFVAEQLFEQLTKEELAAAVAHELGHVHTHDNFKRAVLRACRDALLFNPCGRALDRRWAEASEGAADEHAARRGGSAALDLASALVKIARLAPAGARPAMPAGAFLVGDADGGSIDTRVRRLLRLAGRPPRRAAGWLMSWGVAFAGLALTVAMAVAPLVHVPEIHVAAHGLIELAVLHLE